MMCSQLPYFASLWDFLLFIHYYCYLLGLIITTATLLFNSISFIHSQGRQLEVHACMLDMYCASTTKASGSPHEIHEYKAFQSHY
jgi:hypothetical protein